MVLPEPAAYHMQSEIVEIERGPRVVVMPEAGAGRVTLQWLFDTGANDDPPGQFGLTHLVEHLAFGPIGRADAPDFDARLGELGGTSDGWTDRERAGWGASAPVDGGGDVARLLALEAERWRGLWIDEAGMALQRRIITEELAETLDTAHGTDRADVDAHLWAGGEPWSRHPQSTPTESASVAEVAARWAELRAHAVFVIAGEVDEGEVRPLLEAAFAHTVEPPARLSRAELGEPGCEAAAPSVSWTRANVALGAVYFAWPVPGRDHPDRVALEALARWMGGARLSTGAECGELVVERWGSWGAIHPHVSRMRHAVAAVAAAGVDEPTLARLRVGALTDLARALGSLEVRARAAGGCVLGGRGPDCLVDEAARWRRVDTEATRCAAKRWLSEGVTIRAFLPPDTAFAPFLPGFAFRPAT